MTGLFVLTIGALFTSCTHDEEYSTLVESKLQTYEKVFKQEFGEISPQQDWGFGTSSIQARTRAYAAMRTRAISGVQKDMPAQPTFRDTNPISKPSKPTFSNTVPSNAKYAKDYQNYQKGDVIYINTAYSELNNPQNTEDLTIYVDGKVTYSGSTNQNGNGTTIVVTEGSTLTLTAVSTNLKVYLAPNATLDLTQAGYATFQNSNAALYMSSGSKVKGEELYFVNNVKVTNDGGTITATNLKVDKSTLWNEGSINVTGQLLAMNDDAYIYNAANKTIEAGSINISNNNDLLYNNGTVKSKGEIKTGNASAEIINNGDLTGASLSLNAGGKMHNVGTTTISGKTDLTNSNSQWMNDGTYTSGSFDVDNYSKQNYNNCKLTVNGNFYLNQGEFVLNSGASVVTKTFTWENTSNFYLNSKSLLKVEGALLTNNYDIDYGFRGVGSDYAVIQAGSITTSDPYEQFRMSYYGKLFVSTKSHFELWYKDGPSNTNQPNYWKESSVKLSFEGDASPVSIPSSKCNPGFESTVVPDTGDPTIPIYGGDVIIKKKTTTSYLYDLSLVDKGRIFCEDLGQIRASDIDFNDVVFDAYIYHAKPVKKIVTTYESDDMPTEVTYEDDNDASSFRYTEVYLLAAGGTLQLNVGGHLVKPTMSDLLWDGVLVNTCVEDGNGLGGSYSNPWQYVKEAGKFTMTDNTNSMELKDIKVSVKYGDEILELNAEQGVAPHKICVPLDLKNGIDVRWPMERVVIKDAYTNFTKYVKNEDETVTFNSDGNTTSESHPTGTGYYNEERQNSCWTNSEAINRDNVYKKAVSYTPRDLDSESGKYLKNESKQDETVDGEFIIPGNGYKSGDPVLVRRRN